MPFTAISRFAPLFIALTFAVATAGGAQDRSTLRMALTVDNIRLHQFALQMIADANGGARTSGTTGYDDSANYIADALTAAGYAVQRQTFSYDAWFPVGPSTLQQAAPGMVAYVEDTDFQLFEHSPSADILAPVTSVDLSLSDPILSTSGCEAADFGGFPVGHIALLQRGTCLFSDKAENAAAAGAVGVIIMNEGNAPDRTSVVFGTLGPTYAAGIPAVASSFDRGVEWAATPGLVMRLVTDVVDGVVSSSNVIADTPGGDPDKVVIVGAALESLPRSPGINSEGSAAAGILEIALQMADLAIVPNNKVRFAFFGGYRHGLVGSTHYLDSLSMAELEAIDLYLGFSALGSPNFGRFVLDGDDSLGGGTSGGSGSDDIELTFRDYYGDPLLGGGLASEPVPIIGFDAAQFGDRGIAVGGLFGGTFATKSTDQALLYGGTAGELFDPCAGRLCDTYDNVSLTGLDQMSDAAAHAVLVYATSTAGLRRSAVEGLVTDVEDLRVPHGIENGLLAKLDAALRAIAEGRDGAAIHQLEAFIF